jgi:hypothetical protein
MEGVQGEEGSFPIHLGVIGARVGGLVKGFGVQVVVFRSFGALLGRIRAWGNAALGFEG